MPRPDDETQIDTQIDLTEVAQEPPEESTDAEREAVGDGEADAGDTVPPSQAQSPHPRPDAVDPAEEASEQPLLGGIDSPSPYRSGGSKR